MSVTFEAVDTEYVEVEEDGFKYSTPAPGFHSINMSNANAADFLRLLGRFRDSEELCGTWQKDEIHNVMRAIIKLKNMNSSDFEKPDSHQGNIIDIGRSADYVARRLDSMMALLKDALIRSVDVRFS